MNKLCSITVECDSQSQDKLYHLFRLRFWIKLFREFFANSMHNIQHFACIIQPFFFLQILLCFNIFEKFRKILEIMRNKTQLSVQRTGNRLGKYHGRSDLKYVGSNLLSEITWKKNFFFQYREKRVVKCT